MGRVFSSFFGSATKPAPVAAPPEPAKKPDKKSSKRAQLIALKATGARGLTDEANTGRRRVLV